MKAPLLVHIGYHKTGTTWMQSALFTPEHGYRQIADHTVVFREIVQPHGLRFDPGPMRDLIASAMAGIAGEIPVISSEILSGHPFQGGHESDEFARRLARIAPDARILISIRDQMNILPSVYMQYLLRGGTMPYDQFFEGASELGYFGFTPEHFEYDLLVAHYQRLFGPNRVFVLPHEHLRDDPDRILGDLAYFSGNTHFAGLISAARTRRGVSYPEYAAPFLRRINHMQSSTLNPNPIISLSRTPGGLYRLVGYILKRPPLARALRNHRPVSYHVRKRFGAYYHDSNKRLRTLVSRLADTPGYD